MKTKSELPAADSWCKDFTSTGIADVILTGGAAITINNLLTPQPRYFALPPLYSCPVSGENVLIRSLNVDGTRGAAVPDNFQNVDCELWVERFLADMDRFLSEPYAAALEANSDSRAKDSLGKVLYAKAGMDGHSGLIAGIADDLDAVLAVADPKLQAGLANAKEELQQQLAVSLAKAYGLSVMIQYDAAVTSQLPTDFLPTKLFGNVTIEGSNAAFTLMEAETEVGTAGTCINVAMTVDDPAHHGEISGTFNYTIAQAEFRATRTITFAGFGASNWLDFIRVLTSTKKPPASLPAGSGQLNVPVPLRWYPALPRLMEQSAYATFAQEKATLAQLSLWTYAFTYSHEHAEQDSVKVTAEFNLAPEAETCRHAASSVRDLFTELAAYMAVAEPLWNLLRGLTDPSAGIPDATLANAATEFATLADNISQYWSTRSPDITATRLEVNPVRTAQYTCLFNARVKYRKNGGEIDTYTLELIPPCTSPAPGASGQWPDVAYVNADGTQTCIPAGTATADTMVYQVPADVFLPATNDAAFRLSWPSLNISEIQHARARLSVERNQRLIKDSHVDTNPKFVFSTNEAAFPGGITPLLDWNQPTPISGSGPGNALHQALDALFPAATRLPGLTTTINVYHQQKLLLDTAHPESPVSMRPVTSIANQPLVDSLADEIQSIISNWSQREQPDPTGGELAFFIQLNSVQENAQIPVLKISLVYSPDTQQG